METKTAVIYLKSGSKIRLMLEDVVIHTQMGDLVSMDWRGVISKKIEWMDFASIEAIVIEN
jgi:hypothetical protein